MKSESSQATAANSDSLRSAADAQGDGPPRGRAEAPGQDATGRRNERLALMSIAAIALIWGYNWVVMKKVLAYTGPFDFAALRTVFGATIMMLMMWVLHPAKRIRAWRRVVLLGILQTGALTLLMQLALLQGGAGKMSILVYTMPFWVIPMAWVCFGDRIRGLQWLALVLAAVGLILTLEPWAVHGDAISEGIAIAAGFCWACSIMVAKWIRRDYDLSVLALTAWQMLFGALALCIAAWLVPEGPIDPAPYFYFALIYNAVLVTGMGWFLWLFALQHLRASVAGLSTLGVPVVSVLAGWLELGEQPNAVELAGMIALGVALVLISVRSLGRQRSDS